ncbi:hypothetical protein IWX50DRAFT_616663 [Phyllosticta citricarpa]
MTNKFNRPQNKQTNKKANHAIKSKGKPGQIGPGQIGPGQTLGTCFLSFLSILPFFHSYILAYLRGWVGRKKKQDKEGLSSLLTRTKPAQIIHKVVVMGKKVVGLNGTLAKHLFAQKVD